LRLEITFEIDKKKMNFIFHRENKIFLTGKEKRACPRENKKRIPAADFVTDFSVTGGQSVWRSDQFILIAMAPLPI
jgi:hypothetical protein